MKKGFTILEIIICLVVIFTLVAILFPVFFLARNYSNRTTTLSNIRQLGVAWTMYYNDYDDTLMRSVYKNEHWWGDNKKIGVLSPYVNLSKLRDPSLDLFKFDNTYNFSGYAYNPIFSPVTNKNIPIDVHFQQITNPSETVSFATGAGLFEVNKSLTLYPISTLTTPNWNFPTFHGRYRGYGIICWADGHASVTRVKYISKNIAYQKYFLGELDKDGNALTSEYFNL